MKKPKTVTVPASRAKAKRECLAPPKTRPSEVKKNVFFLTTPNSKKETLERSLSKKSRPVIKELIEKFDSIMIIPIKNDSPVLVFKMFGKPFCHEWRGEKSSVGDLTEKATFDYEVAWRGKFIGYDFPGEIKQQYGDGFWKLLEVGTFFYDLNYLPDDVTELPLKLLSGTNKLKMLSPGYITPVRNALRKLGVIKETRGKVKKRERIKMARDNIIKYEFIKARRKKPFPIKAIQRTLADFLNQVYKDDPGKAEKYYCSDATIRRVIKAYIKTGVF